MQVGPNVLILAEGDGPIERASVTAGEKSIVTEASAAGSPLVKGIHLGPGGRIRISSSTAVAT